MIIPTFRITQDVDFVYVHINVPYVRVSAAEMVCDGFEFSFWCKPYILKLRFPNLLDGTNEDRCRATYDPEVSHGTFVAYLPKVQPGLHFPDLDLTTKLLHMRIKSNPSSMMTAAGSTFAGTSTECAGSRRSGSAIGPPSIEVISSMRGQDSEDGLGLGQGGFSNAGANNDEDEDDLGIEYTTEDQILGTIGTDTGTSMQMSATGHVFYGFNSRYSHVWGRFREEFVDVLELPDPDSTPANQRRLMRILGENYTFSPARYLADCLGAAEDMVYLAAMDFVPFWARQWDQWREIVKQSKIEEGQKVAAVDVDVAATAAAEPPKPMKSAEELLEASFNHTSGAGGYSDEERRTLAQSLANRELLILPKEQRGLLLGLIDLIYAYCFDHRCTEGEPTTESAHNMTRMSASLSWMDHFQEANDSMHVIICSSMRRAVIYPYLRSWKLARKILVDVARVLFLGKHCILKCLLGLRTVMEHTDTHYMLNKVVIDDYCIWLQTVDFTVLAALASEFNTEKTRFEKSAHSGKSSIGLQLFELETWMELHGYDDQGNEMPVPDSTFNAISRNNAMIDTCMNIQGMLSSSQQDHAGFTAGLVVVPSATTATTAAGKQGLTSMLADLTVGAGRGTGTSAAVGSSNDNFPPSLFSFALSPSPSGKEKEKEKEKARTKPLIEEL